MDIQKNSVVKKQESKLKEIIVDFVGNQKQPENDEVTIEHIMEVFTEEFPEFLLVMAEENWINGYTQALSDMDFMLQKQRTAAKSEKDKIDNI
jgi:trans-2-enoyl-CoA reductase